MDGLISGKGLKPGGGLKSGILRYFKIVKHLPVFLKPCYVIYLLVGGRGGEPRGPYSQILMTGGSDRGSYFVPKKITTSEFVYPKKSLLFLVYSPKSLSPCFATQKNIPLIFFATQKNLGVFHRPQKITFGQNFRPTKITRTPGPLFKNI